MQVDELYVNPTLCQGCGCEVPVPGMCTTCNEDFWTRLMVEEAHEAEKREPMEPARG